MGKGGKKGGKKGRKGYKFITMLMCLLTLGAYANAASVSVTGSPSAHFYKDAKTSVGTGAKVVVDDLIIPNVSLRSGLEYSEASIDSKSTITIFPVTSGSKLDLTNWSFETGYNFQVVDKLVITPVVGLDVLFVSSEFVKSDNDTGAHIGVEAKYAVTNNFSVGGQIGYQWLSVSVKDNIGAVSKIQLDNVYIGINGTLKF